MGWAGTSDDIKHKLLGLFILGWLNSYAEPQINNTYVGISTSNILLLTFIENIICM